jgi:hypothetical protein
MWVWANGISLADFKRCFECSEGADSFLHGFGVTAEKGASQR